MKSTVIERLKYNLNNHPQKIIVQDRDRSWTWTQILERANDYKTAISQLSTQPKIAPLIADRSGETVAAMLGCLLAQCGFAPISGSQPKDRIQHCLSALSAKALIITAPNEFPEVFEDVEQIKPLPQNKLPQSIEHHYFQDKEIIYTLFTSGSTGVPKGVLVSAGNIENTMLWSQDILDWKADDVIGGATNFFFDISIFDFFSMIYFNVTLGIYSHMSDTQKVKEETQKYKVTSIFSVPLFFCQISRLEFPQNKECFKSLRRIISGGDFFPPKHILNWMTEAPKTQIYNVWGPTETSIVNTMHLVTSQDTMLLKEGKCPSVGKSHPRMEFTIVGQDRQTILKNPNDIGEIVMLGECVSQGYLNSPEQMKKAYGTINNQRAYFTEDLGYIDANGDLFITGRIGSTIKISGYRVDLGEIDAAAVAFDNIYLANSFIKNPAPEIEELWLIVELKDKSARLDVFNFKNCLRKALPHYMVPKRIFTIDKMPLNPNGKIDRRLVKEGIYE